MTSAVPATAVPPWRVDREAECVHSAPHGGPCAHPPELGFESAGAIPVPLAWPDRLLAADLGLDDADRDDLKAEGWKVMELGAKLVKVVCPVFCGVG